MFDKCTLYAIRGKTSLPPPKQNIHWHTNDWGDTVSGALGRRAGDVVLGVIGGQRSGIGTTTETSARKKNLLTGMGIMGPIKKFEPGLGREGVYVDMDPEKKRVSVYYHQPGPFSLSTHPLIERRHK